MSATYRIALTSEHYATALARFRRHDPHYRRRRALQAMLLAASIASLLYAALSRSRGTAVAAVLGAGGALWMLVRALLQRAAIAKAVRSAPAYGEIVTITLEEGGARSAARDGMSEVAWSLFTRASRFADGFVLSQGRLDSWLPDAALTAATPLEVEALLRSKLINFESIAAN